MALTFSNIKDQQTMDIIGGMSGAEPITGGYKVPVSSYGPAPAPVSASLPASGRSRNIYTDPVSAGFSTPEFPGYFRSPQSSSSSSRVSSARTGAGTVSGDYSTSQAWAPPSDAMPTMEAGQFAAPEFDDRQVSKYSQQFAAPNIRRMRDTVQAAMSSAEDNPNVAALKGRATLSGYGQGLENVMAGAYGQALTKYNQEYSRMYNERMTNFNAAENVKRQNFQAAINSWMKRGTATTSRTSSGAKTATASGSATNGGYNTPTGNLGYYGMDGEWHEGMPQSPV
ncbi:MAG: hypothetical protein KAV87_28160 [Desulfobacteraceae bacterium]|nr:hypothetical protein [Desulfobacteraceae bacterium]